MLLNAASRVGWATPVMAMARAQAVMIWRMVVGFLADGKIEEGDLRVASMLLGAGPQGSDSWVQEDPVAYPYPLIPHRGER